AGGVAWGHAVSGLEEVPQHAVRRPAGPRRGADERDRRAVAQDRGGRAHQAARRTSRELSGTNQRSAPTAPPNATICAGLNRPATAPRMAYPPGVSANEPKTSRLTTRERKLPGTSSVRSVVQSEIAIPSQKPRQATATRANVNECVSATTTMPRSLIPNAA